MKNCPYCEGRGFVLGWLMRDNRQVPNLEQCRNKCNLRGYSDEVQRRIDSINRQHQPQPQQRDPCQVIQFRPRQKSES